MYTILRSNKLLVLNWPEGVPHPKLSQKRGISLLGTVKSRRLAAAFQSRDPLQCVASDTIPTKLRSGGGPGYYLAILGVAPEPTSQHARGIRVWYRVCADGAEEIRHDRGGLPRKVTSSSETPSHKSRRTGPKVSRSKKRHASSIECEDSPDDEEVDELSDSSHHTTKSRMQTDMPKSQGTKGASEQGSDEPGDDVQLTVATRSSTGQAEASVLRSAKRRASSIRREDSADEQVEQLSDSSRRAHPLRSSRRSTTKANKRKLRESKGACHQGDDDCDDERQSPVATRSSTRRAKVDVDVDVPPKKRKVAVEHADSGDEYKLDCGDTRAEFLRDIVALISSAPGMSNKHLRWM
ncbi:hypothetical protein OBBRIDRAFT_526429 [Obba rivulosa]|uniref:Uncharacterized protein n=1 Tax=Obba rivulosa TaxID=1052685 RepID=A0A8E2AFQ8_9APHY|nr:hypothetical protein OBBRIDRAFT_526429 [Obba rivulosa]